MGQGLLPTIIEQTTPGATGANVTSPHFKEIAGEMTLKKNPKVTQVLRKLQKSLTEKQENDQKLAEKLDQKLLADSEDPDFNKDLEDVTRDVQELIKASTELSQRAAEEIIEQKRQHNKGGFKFNRFLAASAMGQTLTTKPSIEPLSTIPRTQDISVTSPARKKTLDH